MITTLAWIGGFTVLLIASLLLVFGIGWTIDFVAKVKNYEAAKALGDKVDHLGKTCNELMDERDALRDEVELLRTCSPYRGPSPSQATGGDKP